MKILNCLGSIDYMFRVLDLGALLTVKFEVQG